MGSPPTENPGLRGGGQATRVSGCDEYVQRSCAAHCSAKASAHPFARSIHLDLGPTPVVGECRSHPVTVRMNVGSPATVVLLQRATRRPPPGALRPSSMCPTDCAAIWCMRGAMRAARPKHTSPSAGLTRRPLAGLGEGDSTLEGGYPLERGPILRSLSSYVGRPPTVARVWSVPCDPGTTLRSLSSSPRPPTSPSVCRAAFRHSRTLQHCRCILGRIRGL